MTQLVKLIFPDALLTQTLYLHKPINMTIKYLQIQVNIMSKKVNDANERQLLITFKFCKPLKLIRR